jgi:hypothetical protein
MLQDLIKERLAFLEPTHLNLKDLSEKTFEELNENSI